MLSIGIVIQRSHKNSHLLAKPVSGSLHVVQQSQENPHLQSSALLTWLQGGCEGIILNTAS